jgi:hypothetical protein
MSDHDIDLNVPQGVDQTRVDNGPKCAGWQIFFNII